MVINPESKILIFVVIHDDKALNQYDVLCELHFDEISYHVLRTNDPVPPVVFQYNGKDADLKTFTTKGNSLIILQKVGLSYELLENRTGLTNTTKWNEVITQFVTNMLDTELTDNGLWKWGQIVKETREYMCVDCGFITTFTQGQLFPICEVCLSGDVDGPVGPSQGYWQAI